MLDVLIVDDDAIFGEVVLEVLQEGGLSAAFQHGPFGASNRIRKETPRLLILDLNMPGIPGPELMKLVHDLRRLSGLKILIMSSSDEATMRQVARDHDADGYISKTAENTDLLAKVRAVLESGDRI